MSDRHAVRALLYVLRMRRERIAESAPRGVLLDLDASIRRLDDRLTRSDRRTRGRDERAEPPLYLPPPRTPTEQPSRESGEDE